QIRHEEIYIAIQELEREEGFSIVMLCDIAEIARSAYYKWLKREPSKRERESEKLMKEITTLFEKVKGIYG
ncbi:IS3-like element ISEnfa5 family transposase, partial [Sutcliffiella horikoshii]